MMMMMMMISLSTHKKQKNTKSGVKKKKKIFFVVVCFNLITPDKLLNPYSNTNTNNNPTSLPNKIKHDYIFLYNDD